MVCDRLCKTSKSSEIICLILGQVISYSLIVLSSHFSPFVISAPSLKGSGECGTLYKADPLDACSPLKNIVPKIKEGGLSLFALIVRGGCSFEDKVRRAQIAGFKAAIVYDNEDGDLVASMFSQYCNSWPLLYIIFLYDLCALLFVIKNPFIVEVRGLML